MVAKLFKDLDEVFKFQSGLKGPHPIVLSAPTGKVSPILQDTTGPVPRSIGRLAKKISLFSDTWRDSAKSITIGEFVDVMCQPVEYEGSQIVGYTEFKSRFRNKVSNGKLWALPGASPAIRETPFIPPDISKPLPSWKGISGCTLRTILSMPRKNRNGHEENAFIEDAVVTADEKIIVATTDSVYSFGAPSNALGIRKSETLFGGEDFFEGTIGLDSGGNLLVANEFTQGLYRTSVEQIVSDSIDYSPTLLFNRFTGRSLLISIGEQGEDDPIYRLEGDKLVLEGSFVDLTNSDDIVETSKNQLAWIETSKGRVVQYFNGEHNTRLSQIEGLMAITCTQSHLFVLAYSGQVVFRLPIDPTRNKIEYVDLSDTEIIQEFKTPSGHGRWHPIGSEEQFIVAASNKILELDLTGAKWQTWKH